MTTGLLALLLSLGVSATPPDVYTMRNHHLEIPIRINDAKRADIRELELHVSTDQGRTWTLAGRAAPDQRAFGFHARGDGLYWFGVCAIDRGGRRDPEDIANAPPALKVLIDTAHPALQVVAVDRVGEEVQVAWECSDSQADPSSLRLEYRPAGSEPTAVWTPVTVPPQVNGTYRFRPVHGGAITVRMQITDSGGSPATVVRDVPAAVGAVPPAAVASTYSMPPAPAPAPVVPPPAAAIQQANSVSPPPVSAGAAPLGQMPATVNPQPAPDAPTPLPAPPAPIMAPPSSSALDVPSGPPALAPLRSNIEPTSRPVANPGLTDFPTPPVPPTRGMSDLQHVRDRQVAIDFEVDRKGPSGVKKIEVYMTQDDGRTWQRYTESYDVNPPLQITLPNNDGLYGFRLVLYSGVNQTVGPPQSGEAPDVRLLVDRTTPQVELFAPVLDSAQANALVLRYKAADLNLVPSTVALYWSSRPDSGWQPVNASGPKQSQWAGVKECVWTLPPDVPEGVYLRLTARDQAGNIGEFVTRDAVTVDLHKPIARVKAVMPAGLRRP